MLWTLEVSTSSTLLRSNLKPWLGIVKSNSKLYKIHCNAVVFLLFWLIVVGFGFLLICLWFGFQSSVFRGFFVCLLVFGIISGLCFFCFLFAFILN